MLNTYQHSLVVGRDCERDRTVKLRMVEQSRITAVERLIDGAVQVQTEQEPAVCNTSYDVDCIVGLNCGVDDDMSLVGMARQARCHPYTLITKIGNHITVFVRRANPPLHIVAKVAVHSTVIETSMFGAIKPSDH